MRVVMPLLAVACAGTPPPAPSAPGLEVAEVGTDAGAGSVLSVQAWVTPLDYASPERLDARLRPWLEEARDRGWLGPTAVVVLPEYVGTWLVASGEPPGTFA